MLAVANQQLKYNLDVDHIETDNILDLNMILQVPQESPLNIPVREFLQRVAYVIHGHEFQPFLQINKKWNDPNVTVLTYKKELGEVVEVFVANLVAYI